MVRNSFTVVIKRKLVQISCEKWQEILLLKGPILLDSNTIYQNHSGKESLKVILSKGKWVENWIIFDDFLVDF